MINTDFGTPKNHGFSGASQQSSFLKDTLQTCLTGVSQASGNLDTITCNVRIDGIINITRRSWSGHVYNLQTTTGWYIANGVITHNCRCAMIPVTKTWKELGFPEIPDTPQPPTGIELFASLSPEIQQSILGKGKYHRYLMGTLALSDLVGIQDDAIRGSMVYERSLREIDGES